MRRDWNLIREILLSVEQLSTYRDTLRPQQLSEYDVCEVSYHIHLLIEAKLITGKCKTGLDDITCTAENLTWQGHEFLDGIRDNSHWIQVKQSLTDKSIALSFEAIKTVVSLYISQRLQ